MHLEALLPVGDIGTGPDAIHDSAGAGSKPGSRTTFVNAHHERIAGKSHDDHLSAITHYHKVVADLL